VNQAAKYFNRLLSLMISPTSLLFFFSLLLGHKALNDVRTQGPSQSWYLFEHCLEEFQVQAAKYSNPAAQELLQ